MIIIHKKIQISYKTMNGGEFLFRSRLQFAVSGNSDWI